MPDQPPRLPSRVWNDTSDAYELERLVDLPIGYEGRTCPRCNSSTITGALVRTADHQPAIPGADDSDPLILCLTCGYFDDSFRSPVGE
jgi:hypothetical protein